MHVEFKHRQDCLCSCLCAFAEVLLMCVCRLQPIFEAAAKKGNNSVNRIQFLNTTAVVTVTMWHIRQQGGCVSSLMTKSESSRDPKKIRTGSKAQLDLGSVSGNRRSVRAQTVAWMQPAKCTQWWLQRCQRAQ